ncbi:MULTISPECIES: aspartate kinase [unclassified Stygiolobus]|uniref:aspartate kinase n=1 Tax=unclassified Stygiolobus TaxID=2824672 RepID=UPI00307F5872
MRVVKVGGSIQKDEKDYELILEKIREYSSDSSFNKNIVVTSAIKNVTNQLLEAINQTDKSVDIISDIYDRHIRLLSKLVDGIEFERAFKNLSKLADELYKVAWSIRVLDEVTPKVRDYILSFGERLAVIVLSAYLDSNKLNVGYLPEPPLITDENFGEANVLLPESTDYLTKKLEEINKPITVVPGFIGISKSHKFTTIGRGGSDYTATLIGKLLNAKEVRLITEVPGIMTADPKKINNAITIPRLSLEEAIELSQLGAKRLHPRTFDPIFGSNMKVIIEGLYEEGDTVIEGLCTPNDLLKGITMNDNLKLVTIESTRIVGKIGSAATITTEVKNANVNIVAISQPASETVIQLVVNNEDSERMMKRLNQLDTLIKEVEVEDVGAISIVGCGLRNKEISSKVLTRASAFNPLFISRGLKGVSITFISNKRESEQLAKDLHKVVLEWSTK